MALDPEDRRRRGDRIRLDASAEAGVMSARRRVVILDDDEPMREAARANLIAHGYEVEDYGSAEEALVALRRAPAAAAIVDFDVARRQGVDLAAAICETEQLEDVALIGVSFDLARVDLELRGDAPAGGSGG